MNGLDIAEVASRSGVAASALRYYEEKGLITSIGRRGQRRIFDESVLERLAFIALGRVAGFSLDDIARVFGAEGSPRIDRSLLTAKANELDARIEELIAMRDGLRHAAACRAPSHMECPTFRRILADAAAGRIGPRSPKRGHLESQRAVLLTFARVRSTVVSTESSARF